ncbi:MAG: GLPGLI family protein [Saprospiraceae bacterium]|nr:GLPGLI family protein [Lewinella sp.]
MQFHLFIFCVFLVTSLQAQSAIEVWYTSPVQKADGEFAGSSTRYRLQCDPHYSLFVSQHSGSSMDYDEETQQFAMDFGGGANWLYKDNVRQLLTNYVTSFQERHFIIEDGLHPIQWKILPDKKLIGEITVQKARGEFRGRTYSAWFARSIPLSNGPWKLGGLPGLILEAYDDDKLVVFLFHSIRPLQQKSIAMPESREAKITLPAFQKLFEDEVNQYFDFLNARLRKEGSNVTYTTGDFELWEYPE